MSLPSRGHVITKVQSQERGSTSSQELDGRGRVEEAREVGAQPPGSVPRAVGSRRGPEGRVLGSGAQGAAEWKAGRRDWGAGTWLEAGNRVAGNRGALGRSAEWKKSHWIQEEVTTGKAA